MNQVVNTALNISSLGILIGMVMKLMDMPYGHTISLYCFLGFAIFYPIQFFMMKNKNALAYVRFVIIWGVCLLYIGYIITGGYKNLPL